MAPAARPREAIPRFLGGKRKLQAHGPRHFLARFAVAKKKPGNRALWLVECAGSTDNPLGGQFNKGWPETGNFHPQVPWREWFKVFSLRLVISGQISGKFPN
jgi:hypothetical protein